MKKKIGFLENELELYSSASNTFWLNWCSMLSTHMKLLNKSKIYHLMNFSFQKKELNKSKIGLNGFQSSTKGEI